MPRIRVLVADDHAVLRAGLKMLIGSQPDMEVVAEAGDGEAALRRAQDTRPDVAIMDVPLPLPSGLELLVAMRRAGWMIPVILLSLYVDQRLQSFSNEFRVFTCLTKPVSSAKLSRAVERALDRGPAA